MVLGNSTIDLELLPRLWDKGFTPVYTEKLIGLLNVYSKRDDAEILKNGFLNGFLLNYIGPRVHLECTNLLSALQHRYETLDKLQHEVELGRMLGPFSNLPISNLRISPIGLVAKPDGGLRLITNCSAPEGNSVNSYIEEQFCKVKYSSLDQILDKIYDAGHRAKLAKNLYKKCLTSICLV